MHASALTLLPNPHAILDTGQFGSDSRGLHRRRLDRRIRTVSETGRHEAFLKTFYPRAELVAFATPAEARADARLPGTAIIR